MNASLLMLSLATAAAAPQDVLYDFYSTHCGPCQMMMPIVERLHAEGYPVVKINIDERPDMMQRFGIQVVPTFVLVVGGQEWQRVSGLQEESNLRAMLAQLPKRATRPADRPTRRSVPIRLADDEHYDEGWERVTDENDLYGIDAAKLAGESWWQVSVAAAEFVRGEPFEGEFRQRIGNNLRVDHR